MISILQLAVKKYERMTFKRSTSAECQDIGDVLPFSADVGHD